MASDEFLERIDQSKRNLKDHVAAYKTKSSVLTDRSIIFFPKSSCSKRACMYVRRKLFAAIETCCADPSKLTTEMCNFAGRGFKR